MESRVSGKAYFLYVLWSETGRRFYIGISENTDQRLDQHNSGEFHGWTNRYRPWSLVHVERYETYRDARVRELELKAQKGGAGFFAKTGLDPSDYGRGS